MMRFAMLILLILALGVTAAPVPRTALPDPFGRGKFGVFPESEEELVIREVDPDSPASRGGLQKGDLFISVGHLKPKSFVQLRQYVMNMRPGTQALVTVRRNGEFVTLTITVGQRTENESSLPLPGFPIDR